MEIEIVPLDHEVNVDDFCFENGSMNIQLRKAYYYQVMKLKSVKEIYCENKSVGFYIISITPVDSENITYSAIKLDILCIEINHQNMNIGTKVLMHIISEATDFSNFAGCRYLILDALKGKYDWYFDRGFTPFDENDLDNEDPTITMYYDFRNNELLNDYAEE